MMPCRHFEVLAPGDGVLFVEVVWSPEPGAEGVALIIAGVTQRLLLGGHRVLAGAAYGITVVYSPSHTEYLEYSRPVGEFSIKTTFESRRWL
jgi:hypothetical protein